MAEGVSIPLVNSRSKSLPLSLPSGASMSYAPASDVCRWLEGAGMEVIGRGEVTSSSKVVGSTASGTQGAVGWLEED